MSEYIYNFDTQLGKVQTAIQKNGELVLITVKVFGIGKEISLKKEQFIQDLEKFLQWLKT